MKVPMNKVNCSSGFTMLELMVVVAIVTIAATFAIPQMGQMIRSYYLRSATMSLVSELQSLKLTALKENKEAKLMIVQESGVYKYQSFLDINDDNIIDTGEQINQKVVDDSVSVANNFAGNVVGFTNRGMPSNGVGGTVTLSTPGGKINLLVIVNAVGNIRTQSQAVP